MIVPQAHLSVMKNPELSDDEALTLVGLLRRTIFDERYQTEPVGSHPPSAPGLRREPMPPLRGSLNGGRVER
jgi:hypothetical protein